MTKAPAPPEKLDPQDTGRETWHPDLEALLDRHYGRLQADADRRHGETLAAIADLKQGQDILMAKTDDVAAAIAANTATIKAMVTKITTLDDGQASIQAEIDALKAQIAAGTPPDFTAVDAAMADQTAAIGQLSALVPTP
jgi:chromosome segregation ATPase